MISCPRTFGFTFSINSLATSRVTSASSKACLILLSPHLLVPHQVKELFLKKKKFLRIYLLNFQTYLLRTAVIALVGEASLTSVDLFVTKDTAKLTFLRKRRQPIIEVQKVNK